MEQIEAYGTRVAVVEGKGKLFASLAYRKGEHWKTVLATGFVSPPNMWATELHTLTEDPELEWQAEGATTRAAGFLSAYARRGDKLVLSGERRPHSIEMEFSIMATGHVRVAVRDTVAPGSRDALRLGRLMSHIYFVPDGKAARAAEPLEFAWLPALHRESSDVCADHFFRSPCVAVAGLGHFGALLPDLEVFRQYRGLPHALDLRTTETLIEAPRLSYGICPSHAHDHVYYRHGSTDFLPLDEKPPQYAFDLLFGPNDTPEHVAALVSGYLWERYGRRTLKNIRPQVLPFAEYGRRYAYKNELCQTVKHTRINGSKCAGLNNEARRGANFHAWENDLHVAFGIKHYGEKWKDRELVEIADGILEMTLQAPRNKGAFPCIYNFATDRYEGTLYWTARAADPVSGYDSSAMGVTAWWQLRWHEHLAAAPDALKAARGYAHFLKASQSFSSGAIPTYFFPDLTPARQLAQSSTTAISGAVLARLARLDGNPELREAALRAGHFVNTAIVPGLNFDDFEAYYSCSPKPLHALDYWTGIRPHCNLSIQWACDQFLELHYMTGDEFWLRRGEYLLNILSLYQQVWAPSHLRGYLFGGFGVQNTDGEWSDGRQARFVSTYADYYQATGKAEYLERALAACRASFTTMDIRENHANGINHPDDYKIDCYAKGKIPTERGLGYAPENLFHVTSTSVTGWSGFNWGPGGALAASADLERRFGGVWLDAACRKAFALDGVCASVDDWSQGNVRLRVASALSDLPLPHSEKRAVVIKLGRGSSESYNLSVNGGAPRQYSAAELHTGVSMVVE